MLTAASFSFAQLASTSPGRPRVCTGRISRTVRRERSLAVLTTLAKLPSVSKPRRSLTTETLNPSESFCPSTLSVFFSVFFADLFLRSQAIPSDHPSTSSSRRDRESAPLRHQVPSIRQEHESQQFDLPSQGWNQSSSSGRALSSPPSERSGPRLRFVLAFLLLSLFARLDLN